MTLIISGASTLVDNAWPTWASFVKQRYANANIVDLSCKGLGNKAIILRAIAAAQSQIDPYVIIQLTNIDKWDWYIEDTSLIEQLNYEKHPIVPVTKNDSHGFWSTGSHFPLYKEYYQKNYFSLENSAFETLLLLQWFMFVCKQNFWKNLILLDSPILSVTESQLNHNQLTKEQCWNKTLIENILCQSIFTGLNLDCVYIPGMIGHACLNNRVWYSKKYKNHPGSLVHYWFAVDKIFPILNNFFEQIPCENLLSEATKFDKLAHI